jgi:hypothetical protein
MRLTTLVTLLTLGVSTVLAAPAPSDDWSKKKFECEKDGNARRSKLLGLSSNHLIGKHEYKQDSKGNWFCHEKKEVCDYWCEKNKCEKDGNVI